MFGLDDLTALDGDLMFGLDALFGVEDAICWVCAGLVGNHFLNIKRLQDQIGIQLAPKSRTKALGHKKHIFLKRVL